MSIAKRFSAKILDRLLPPPVKAAHGAYSMVFSAIDEPGTASERLLDLALEAVSGARKVSMEDLRARVKQGPFYAGVWPGEHYKLLAGLALAVKPGTAVEIGTATGLSALALTKGMPGTGALHTFDLTPWRNFKDTCFTPEDFAGGRIVQHLDDLGVMDNILKHRVLLEAADLIFIDAPKDGYFEQRLIENFSRISLKEGTVLIFDDIRLWNMLSVWRGISMPKLDLTSFGHWSGTGLVEWKRK